MKRAAIFLDPITFADDTTLIYSGENISNLFATVNSELHSVSEWVTTSELSLNVPS